MEDRKIKFDSVWFLSQNSILIILIINKKYILNKTLDNKMPKKNKEKINKLNNIMPTIYSDNI